MNEILAYFKSLPRRTLQRELRKYTQDPSLRLSCAYPAPILRLSCAYPVPMGVRRPAADGDLVVVSRPTAGNGGTTMVPRSNYLIQTKVSGL